jgi:(p)ppGpp synthase/HD superfamily hydrolase
MNVARGGTELSKKQVKKAGDRLQKARRGLLEMSAEQRLHDIAIVDRWRQLHAEPLAWVTDALGRRIGPLATQVVLAQRLKRMPQIIGKLARYETMKLDQMQDVGGCRAIFASLDEVDEAARLIRTYGSNRWEIRQWSDYRQDGRSDTGYRALHIVVVRSERLIEIQLRTMRQHAWAETVERVDALTHHHVKEGRAPDEFKEYFFLASDGFHARDTGIGVSPAHRRRFRQLHATVGQYVITEAA